MDYADGTNERLGYTFGDTAGQPRHAVESVTRTRRAQSSSGIEVELRHLDHAGRLAEAEDAMGSRTSYRYDGLGELMELERMVGTATAETTTITRDDHGRVTEQVVPATGQYLYAYNGFDELALTTDARGVTTSRSNDALGRPLTEITLGLDVGTRQHTWTYDVGTSGVGRLAFSTSADGITTEYQYNALGSPSEGLRRQVARVIDGERFETDFYYDSLGGLQQVEYPANFRGERYRAIYDRDQLGNAVAIYLSDGQSAPSTPIWTLDEAHQGLSSSRETFGNGTQLEVGYDSGGVASQASLHQGRATEQRFSENRTPTSRVTHSRLA